MLLTAVPQVPVLTVCTGD